MASQIRVISTSNVQTVAARSGDPTPKIELTPWDLQLLLVDPIQKGLLFRKPRASMDSVIHRLKASLSSTLDFFPPLAGRLTFDEYDDGTCSVFVLCNNSGALFVHAAADDFTVSDILQPTYTPRIVHSFFPLNGVRNYKGTSKPLLGVQVTELRDGVFIGCTVNHVVADGTSFWHFFNSWSEISRGSSELSKPPALERWFIDGINRPIRIRLAEAKEKMKFDGHLNSQLRQERVFHFSSEKVAELKAKANAMACSNMISSLQATLTHLWRAIVRNQGTDPEEEVNYRLLIGIRPRMSPPLPQNYFGNALQDGTVSMKAEELLSQDGLGKAALEMNKMVALHTEEKLVSHVRSWMKNPRLLTEHGVAGNALATSSSPRFDVYGNDFGWGKPVAVRSGAGNKRYGKITVFAGAENGSIDMEVSLSYEILEAMAKDSEFMDAVSAASYD
ncbi:protein ENHANCED PSEUDOMONAS SUSCEPTIBILTY 1 [Neltuma alba]|uniref:protein ENHANCED PSEUDOMONAS SUSCEPTIBILTY 1 n=1 Tax=Neltuma alba TaxID=207710 RepID=UPI0010A414A6|nr:protein ENHANCED PSEUDOMONAS SUSCEPTIBILTY 1-like [Prosopis alba]